MRKGTGCFRRRDIIWLLVITLFLTAIWALHLDLRVARNSPQLTYIHWFNDRSLYPNAVLAMTNQYLYSAYYVLLGLLGKVIPPVVVLYLMLFVTNLLAVFSVFWLACVITRRKTVGYLAVVLLLFHNPYSFGGSGGFIGNPTPGAFSISLCFFAIGLFLRGSYVAAFALIGITANFYGSYAFYTAAMFATYYALHLRRMNKRTIGKSLLVCAICASPLLIWMLASGYAPGTGSLPFEQWYTLVMYRSSGHVSPFSWPARTYLSFLPHVFFLFLWRPTKQGSQIRNKIWALTLGVFLLCVAGTLFVEVIPIQQVIQFVLFRSTKFVMAFGVIAGVTHFAEQWGTRRLARWLYAGAVATFFLGRFDVLYPLLVLLYVDRFFARRRRVDLVMVGLLIVISAYAWMKLQAALDIRLLVACSGAALVVLVSQLKLRWKTPIAVGVVAVVLVSMSPLGLYERYSASSLAYYGAMKDAQLWLAENTPPDRLIMTPPQTRMWSGFSQRGVFLNYVDVAMPIYAPLLGQEVVRRANEYVGDMFAIIERGESLTVTMKRAYLSWDEGDFRRIADEYGCSVAVVAKPRVLDLPMVYENGFFRIYAVGRDILDDFEGLSMGSDGGGSRSAAVVTEDRKDGDDP